MYRKYILTGENQGQYKYVVISLSFIGQLEHPVGGWDMSKGGVDRYFNPYIQQVSCRKSAVGYE